MFLNKTNQRHGVFMPGINSMDINSMDDDESDEEKKTSESDPFGYDTDEHDLQALIDSALNLTERRAMMQEILTSPALLDRVEELLRQKALIQRSQHLHGKKNVH